jgi:4-O-beta-D-mannosyl-D-glucose phosphorylase
VLYLFLADINEPWRVTHRPAGYLLAPMGEERVGDVSNVAFANGWVRRAHDEVLLYYAASDTRLHVARSSVARLLDYALHTPEDPLRSAACVAQRCALIAHNQAVARHSGNALIRRAARV